MDKKIFFIAAVVAALAAVIIYNLYSIVSLKQTVVVNNLPVKVKDIAENQIVPEKKDPITPVPVFGLPLEQAEERITKKKFGQYITSQNSPVQPEKFRGYHTGTDFEIFLEELNANVPVQAIGDGKIALKVTAPGYGGSLVENCELDNQLITVIYGHLKLASIAKKAGDTLAKGEEIGILGKAFSAETSGERKHLHLGVHKGSAVDIRGYVQKEAELANWLDAVRNMFL